MAIGLSVEKNSLKNGIQHRQMTSGKTNASEGSLTQQQLGAHGQVDKNAVDNNKYFTLPKSMCLLT